jgi:hypothetical protein
MIYSHIENQKQRNSPTGFSSCFEIALLIIIIAISFFIYKKYEGSTLILINKPTPVKTEKISLTSAQHRELVTTLRKKKMSDSQLDYFMNRLGIDDAATKTYIQRVTEQSDWESLLNIIAGFSKDYRVASTTPPPSRIPQPLKIRNSYGQIIPTVMRETRASNIHYNTPSNFRNYAFYPVREFLDANGWSLTSNRAYTELPDSIIEKVREIGDYLYAHYRYGTRKTFDGLGEDYDGVFDCDDFAALMYRMGRQAGLEMYIIDFSDHWANAVRYNNTLYTIEPQGYDKVRYRETVKFGARNVTQYALYTENIVVEKE